MMIVKRNVGGSLFAALPTVYPAQSVKHVNITAITKPSLAHLPRSTISILFRNRSFQLNPQVQSYSQGIPIKKYNDNLIPTIMKSSP